MLLGRLLCLTLSLIGGGDEVSTENCASDGLNLAGSNGECTERVVRICDQLAPKPVEHGAEVLFVSLFRFAKGYFF